MAAATFYGDTPPMVNVARKPGDWQTYDIVFEAPRFKGPQLISPAYVTVSGTASWCTTGGW